MTTKILPLKNVKVLDLSRILAGPYATQLFGDYGAEIIKVEPVLGDDTRHWKPPCDKNGTSTYFDAINRNKRSLALDLRKKSAQRVVQRLSARVDCVIENFVPGTAEKYNVDYDTLAALNPRLVYGSLSGYGPLGTPKARHAAYDVMISAAGGLMSVTGTAAEPVKVGVAVTDIMSGMALLSGVVAALYAREHNGGRGARVSTSLLETQVNAMANVASAYLNAGAEGSRRGTSHASIVPYQVFATRDARIAMGALNDAQWQRLLRALEGTFDATGAHGTPHAPCRSNARVQHNEGAPSSPSSSADAEATFAAAPPPSMRAATRVPFGDIVRELRHDSYASNAQRVAHRDVICDALQRLLCARDTSYWERLFNDAGLPNSPINGMREVFADEHNAALRLVHTASNGVRYVRSPVTFSEPHARVADVLRSDESQSHCLPPPCLGEHSREILLEAGFSSVEIEALMKEDAIR